MLPTQASSPLALRQYTKDVPPGWRPRAYPIKEYKNALDVWSRLSRLDPDQLGPAIMSRLEGGALKFAEGMTVHRQQADGAVHTYRGIEAVSLLAQQAIQDPQTGQEICPAYPSGAKTLITQLMSLHYLDDQDLAWTSLDKFFTFVRPHDMDFGTYVTEWNRLFDEAALHGNLQVGPTGKCWLFFSRSGISDKDFRDLRLKVDGDLTRYTEMVGLYLKICRNEEATLDQHHGYKQFQANDYDDYDESGYYDEWGYWTYYDDWNWDYDEYDEYYDDYDDDYQGDYGYEVDDEEPDTEEYYGGKGKKGKRKDKGNGKQPSGQQCARCGSKWHNEHNCPMPAEGKGTNSDTNHSKDDSSEVPAEESEDSEDYYGWDEWYGRYRKGKGKKGKRRKGNGKGGKGFRSRWPRTSFGKGKRQVQRQRQRQERLQTLTIQESPFINS